VVPYVKKLRNKPFLGFFIFSGEVKKRFF
jgi:hypothetical protein